MSGGAQQAFTALALSHNDGAAEDPQQKSNAAPISSVVPTRVSFIRVSVVGKNTTVFLPFRSGADDGASLKAQLKYMLNIPAETRVVLFCIKQEDERKAPMDDSFVVTIMNTDQCSLWFLCTEDEFPSVVVPL